MFINTPVVPITFAEQQIYIKRDDLLHPDFSGNKARKFAYFLEHEFDGVTKLIGYGSPQANSLLSMSALAKLKGWQLDFYVDHIAEQVKLNCVGNYAQAMLNGANIMDLSAVELMGQSIHQYITQTILPNEPSALYVPEGGRCEYAEYGVAKLAGEIELWAKQQNIHNLKVFLPSGTGTTALFLNKYFVEHQLDVKVLTCGTVGRDDYLISQFRLLCSNERCFPEILPLPRKYHFGKLYLDCYRMWQRVTESSGLEFELLYDPIGFIALEKYIEEHADESILYVHQGGLLGNLTMLPRYQRKYPSG